MKTPLAPSGKPPIVVCKHSGSMGGGLAILIGLVFIGLHFSEAATVEAVERGRNASLTFGYILLAVGLGMLGFTRIVEITHAVKTPSFRQGWMVFRTFRVLGKQSYDSVEIRQHLPRFGGYLGMTSTIVWAVVLADSVTSAAGEVTAFPSKAEAEALRDKLAKNETR